MAHTRECDEVREQLAAAVDGDIPAALRAHVSSCDECRDARHAAQRAADLVADAGADFAPPADFEARLLAALDARAAGNDAARSASAAAAPEVNATPRAEPLAPASISAPTTPATSTRSARPRAPEQPAPAELSPVPRASAPKSARTQTLAFAAVIAAAAAVPLLLRGSHPADDHRGTSTQPTASTPTAADGTSAWHGRLALVSRAASDPGAGVEIQPPGGSAFAPAREGQELLAGATVRTDARTRARLEFSDGTRLVLDRDSELRLDPGNPRAARLSRGAAVADVAHLDGSPRARIELPNGAVTVLGTKFALDAASERSTVRVTRGTVKLTDGRGDEVPVQTGQQGVLPRGGAPRVEPAPDLASSIAWSDLTRDVRVEPDAPVVGLGELRARRPGDHTEHDERVHLLSHAVKVRVAGNVARTEVEEVFRNDTGNELEGIYRFPLPPDAQIESLALDVRGEMETGEFVDRQRAAAIWRGVIRNAVQPVAQRVETQEFVWVPGPWRDPALLEWQRGGRFELRVFPIPARGERRVRIAYTQTVPAQGGVRRYVYPLAHDASGSTRVDHFTADVQVLGADASFGVRARGYELTPAAASTPGAVKLAFARDAFVPAGDLAVEYALPDRAEPVTAWAFRPPAESAPRVAPPTVGVTNEPGAAYAAPTREASYVALALRPTLPRWTDARPRDYALVLDASRSMVGERMNRARRLLTAMVGEMDPRDRVTVLACDTACRAMPGGLVAAGSDAARRAENFLAGQEAGGASDLLAQVRAAAAALGSSPDRDAHVVYLGDGTPTAGYRRPDRLEAGVTAALPGGRASLTTVAVGADADTLVLTAMARGGGGALVPYVPGESLAAAALSVLQTTYGVALRDATVTLPDGMTAVYPSRLGTVRAGAEVMLYARMDGESAQGDVVLRGTVGGDPYETKLPLRVLATEDPGNAFVPRLYAAAQIADLEAAPAIGTREQAVALSQRFRVASRYTSLLVLESEAMYRAFGVRHEPGAWWTRWTGEQLSAPTTQDPAQLQAQGGAVEPDPAAVEGLLGDESGGGGGAADENAVDHATTMTTALAAARGHGGTTDMLARLTDPNAGAGETESARAEADDESNAAPAAQPNEASPMPESSATGADTASAGGASRRRSPMNFSASASGTVGRTARPMPAAPAASTTTAATVPPMFGPGLRDRWAPQGHWMRRIHVRRAALGEAREPSPSDLVRVETARAALAASPDSRTRHAELYRALAAAGDADEAAAVAARWAGRDALDPEALGKLADAAARAGDRDRAVRMLAGVVDVRPDDASALERMAALHERAGESERACAYRFSLAEVSPQDPAALAGAARCERAAGRDAAALRWLDGAADVSVRLRAEAQLARLDLASLAQPAGDLVVDARWEGPSDLDVAVITPRGNRVSWLDGRAAVRVRGARDPGAEALSLARLGVGSYLLEVSRTDRGDVTLPARGRLVVTALGRRQVFDFTLEPGQTTRRVARVSVTTEEQLVPM